MNVARTAVLLLLPVLVTGMIPGQVWGQGEPRETTLRRSVPRDAETMAGSVSRWRFQGAQGYALQVHSAA